MIFSLFVFYSVTYLGILIFLLTLIYTLMANLDDLTPDELQKLILEAQSKLEQKQSGMRKEVIAQIKALAASIGVNVEIIDGKSKRLSSVNSKYRNPQNPLQEWTGRGLAPKWLKEYIAAGHSKEDFLISN